MSRVVKFARRGDGGRAFGVRVGRCEILVTAPEGHHDDGEALARRIAEMGPEVHDQEPAQAPRLDSKPTRKRRAFAVGDRVRCIVRGAEGEHTVLAVGDGYRRGQIKVTDVRAWCPAVNFVSVDDAAADMGVL